MSNGDEVLARIDAAMARIRAVTVEDASADAEDAPLFRKVRKLSRSNEVLTEQLAELSAQRERDIAELDALVDELKPLIGDA